MKGLSYVQKTAIPYLILLALSLASISVTTTVFFDQFVLTNLQKELISETTLAAESLEDNPYLTDIDDEAKHIAEITGNRVTIILADGTVIGESDRSALGMDNHLLRPEVQAAINGKPEPFIRTSFSMHQRYIYVAAPIYNKQRIIGVVRLARSLESFDATIAKFRAVLIITASISLLIALIFMFLQTSKKFNPLRKISEAIFSSSEGELKTISGKSRNDEIGLLISSHNAQAERINLQIQNLRNERTKLSAILFNMTDGVILVNAQGFVTMINPSAQRLFQTNFQADKDNTLIEVVRQHQIVDLWQLTLKTGKTQNTTIQTSMEKDNVQVIGSLLGPILPGEVLLLFQDLTLLRKLETVRKDFISNISHELRTPLASLKALTETLQNGAINDPKVSNHFLSQMDEEIDNLTQIVTEILELSKIESGKVPLSKKLCTVNDLVTRPVERMRMQAERAGIMLDAVFAEGLPKIDVDIVRIQQVFVNLIHNAIKFTSPGGTIKVSAFLKDQSIHFSIADNGIGIPPADLKRIFERFYKTDPSRSSSGTGLGLSISKHIVEAHDGTLWVESTMGFGSTFTFCIPISQNKS
jgi:two-component system phosphate regulon sensor histidine kinase PhoR